MLEMWILKLSKIGKTNLIYKKNASLHVSVRLLFSNYLVEKTVQGLTGKCNTFFIFHSYCNQSNVNLIQKY